MKEFGNPDIADLFFVSLIFFLNPKYLSGVIVKQTFSPSWWTDVNLQFNVEVWIVQKNEFSKGGGFLEAFVMDTCSSGWLVQHTSHLTVIATGGK